MIQVGDIVEVENWSDWWNGRIALVSSRDNRYIYIRPLLGPSDHSWIGAEGYGFHETHLKVLGHIDVAQEGEEL